MRELSPPEPFVEEQWIRVDEAPEKKASAKSAGAPTPPSERSLSVVRSKRTKIVDSDVAGGATSSPKRSSSSDFPPEVVTEFKAMFGREATKMLEDLERATAAYERDRYLDAARLLNRLLRVAPESPTVNELLGLASYRLGRWEVALKRLKKSYELTGSSDQLPVHMDCYRALKRYRALEGAWEELKKSSPGTDVLTEGRIVYANSLADRGKLGEAIELIERANKFVKNPRPHHLRQWYVLGDFYERAGEMQKAIAIFVGINKASPGIYDVTERVAELLP